MDTKCTIVIFRVETVKDMLPDNEHFLICESDHNFKSFVVKRLSDVASSNESGFICDLEIQCKDGGRYRLIDGERGQTFGSYRELRSHLKDKYGTQVLPRKCKGMKKNVYKYTQKPSSNRPILLKAL